MTLNLVIALAAVVSAAGAIFLWLETHTDRGLKSREAQVKNILHPFEIRLGNVESDTAHSSDAIEAALSRAIQPVRASLVSLETKMDVLWELQKQAALDAAKILHHPEPGRREIDVLLDAFINDTLTSDEATQLRKKLTIIRDWEPGEDVGFPVYLGEQMAAAAILRVMQFGITTRSNEETTGNGPAA